MHWAYTQQPICGQIPHSPSGEAIWNFTQGTNTILPVVGWTFVRGLLVLPVFLLLKFGWKLSLICALVSTITDTLIVFWYVAKHRLSCRQV